MRCGEPMQFREQGIHLNGTLDDYHYQGRPLMYGCSDGFQLVSNPGMKTVIICNKEGRWSNEGDLETPKCRRKFDVNSVRRQNPGQFSSKHTVSMPFKFYKCILTLLRS